MAEPALVLFDDARARAWQPLTLTRPAGELRFGGMTLRARAERTLGLRCAGHLTDDALRGFDEPGAPPVLGRAALPNDRDLLFLSSRVVPAWGRRPELPAPPALLLLGGEPVGAWLPAGAEPPSEAFLLEPTSAELDAPEIALQGRRLEAVWDLIAEAPEQVARDAAAYEAGAGARAPDAAARIGDGAVVIAPDARIEPGVVFDTRSGPIVLEEGVLVRAHTRLEGPSWIARGSTLLGGPFTAVSVGPGCKVHGEMEESVVLGYSNKAHDGFLGHAYLGRWVNLGALTTNSDLKNNYGSIRLWTPEGAVDTGRMKLGCLLGDHVKTAIGTLLNTGTVVGAGANLFGAGVPPKYIPPFSWGGAAGLAEYDVDKFVETARVVMSRREQTMSESQEAMLREAWRRTRAERNGEER